MATLVFLVSFAFSLIVCSNGQNTVTTTAPCCGMTLGAIACQRLRDHNPRVFCSKCYNDDDFKTLQCCPLCRKSYSLVDGTGTLKTTAARGIPPAGRRLDRQIWAPRAAVAPNRTNTACVDRHANDGTFCSRFLTSGQGGWSCANSSHPHLAFRDCRKTCGYCNLDLYRGTDERTATGAAGPGPSPNCQGAFPMESLSEYVGFCDSYLPAILSAAASQT
uniref:ShKT domain-containing protein n=1 Tax=Plectus sambesii TaxID=2011161 RepID=A0A914UKM4_9BILA